MNCCFISQTQAGEGRIYKCLFNHKFEDAMSEKVSVLQETVLNSALLLLPPPPPKAWPLGHLLCFTNLGAQERISQLTN